MYGKVDPETVKALEAIVGSSSVLTDRQRMEDYSHDEYALDSLKRYPEAVVKPDSTQQVAAILRLAREKKIPVVTRGGATGLCGGTVPVSGGIVLSLERMNRIVEIDRENLMAVCEAGVTLREFYQRLRQEKLFFPPHPGEESATIGGTVATNAGGARAVKYGVVRNFTRGMQVVLADGTVLTLGGKILKDSTGYSLLNLLIGSEGTLGVITQVTLSVMPVPASQITILVPYEDVSSALASVPELLRQGVLPLAIEFVSREVIAKAESYLGESWPVSVGNCFLLVILEGDDDEQVMKAGEKLSEVCLGRGALDIFAAEVWEKQESILRIRSMVYEALKADTIEILDVVLPRTEVEPHLKAIAEISRREDVWLPTYGHAADGNVHTHITKKTAAGSPLEHWEALYPRVRKAIHDDARQRGGRASGEHGIGLVKKEYLGMFVDPAALELMRGIRRVFDPDGILNPGKIFD